MDTANHFKVRSPDGGRTVFFDTNTPSPILVKLTPGEAFNLGAWLIGLAGVCDDDAARFIEKIKRHAKR